MHMVTTRSLTSHAGKPTCSTCMLMPFLQRCVVSLVREVLLRPLLNLADVVLRLLVGLTSPMCCLRRQCDRDPLLCKPSVVIVGGSFAGLWAQRALSDAFDVTLIDLKDYFEYTVSRAPPTAPARPARRLTPTRRRRRSPACCASSCSRATCDTS